jgi:hypothetical protein
MKSGLFRVAPLVQAICPVATGRSYVLGDGWSCT